MKRRNVWIGAGLLFVVLVSSGFVPDIRLAMNLREARETGILPMKKKAHVDPAKDSAMLYNQAFNKFSPLANQLMLDYPTVMKAPTPQLRRYLDAVRVASRREGFSGLESEKYASTDLGQLFSAGRAMTQLATTAEELEDAAHIARHIAQQRTIVSAGQWGFLASRILAKAKTLSLSDADGIKVVAALGPALDLREVLKDHVGQCIEGYELRVEADRIRRAGTTRSEAAYLMFWNGFFRKYPAGTDLVPIIEANEDEIDATNNAMFDYTDFEGLTGSSPKRWGPWAKMIDEAGKAMKAF